MFIYESFVKSGESYAECRRLFTEKFYGFSAPSKSTIHDLVKKLRTTGSLIDQKRERKRSVLTEDKLDEIGENLERSPKKSLRKLSQQMDVSLSSARKATKLLRLHAYKTTVVHSLQPADHGPRMVFSNWITNAVCNGEVDPEMTFFTDEAWFHLSGYVNSQNSRYWCSENPHISHEKPLHDVKVGVWCAVSAKKIIGPIFFNETINSERYIQQILEPFFLELSPNEKFHGYFQQDGATAHTANATINRITEVFEDRIISRNCPVPWPARSPDLNPCDFYLWGKLKDVAYKNNPRTAEELQENIRSSVQAITKEELFLVSNNLLKRADKVLEAGGGHFQHLL